MARSLSQLHAQIAKLQKQADSIQSTVIARIRREIAQHGLTAQHLFGPTNDGLASGANKAAKSTPKTATPKKPNANKPAKYSDDQGNTWHGIGKRPKWVHAALEAGQSLSDFLVGAQRAAPAAKTEPKAARKIAAKRQGAPMKREKAAAVKTATGARAKSAPEAKKAKATAKAAQPAKAARTASKQPASKATRVTKVATKRAKPSAASPVATDQATSA